MSLLTRTKPIDATMRALHEAGEVSAELRERLAECGTRRFHLHRTLMRVRWALDHATNVIEAHDNVDKVLTDAGYGPGTYPAGEEAA